jgi:hypothetical protein
MEQNKREINLTEYQLKLKEKILNGEYGFKEHKIREGLTTVLEVILKEDNYLLYDLLDYIGDERVLRIVSNLLSEKEE